MQIVHSELPEIEQKRLMRLRCDVRALYGLSPAQIRTAYEQIEIARDLLSDILDRSDGKYES
jgi:hypothetical protein